jgi:hypothetical protein
MKRASFLIVPALVFGAAVVAMAQRPASPVVEVYKDPGCGCCSLWADHLKAAGLTVNVTEKADLAAFKTAHGVPQQARSCHTALVGGYVIEGHVPAADIQRLLKERPAVVGLAVPGMPVGSPGMEVKGLKPQAFNVVAFDKDGGARVYAKYNQ